MSEAAERLAAVRARIDAACQAAGRSTESVRLLAVSKVHPAAAIRTFYGLGLRDFGENYAQELQGKAEELRDLTDLRWHFIGNFQSNKAAALAPLCHTVHSVASERAGRALGRRATELGRVVEILLQVNVGEEAQKAGASVDDTPALAESLAAVEGVRLTGLMTIPPAGDPDLAARCYGRLSSLARSLSLPELSMGMSGDLELAIAQGATWVRIGTDLFGARVY